MNHEPNEGQLTAALLGLVAQQPQHGYGLHRSLVALGYRLGHRAVVYHELHRLERRRLISSQWDTAQSGPARRVYTVTSAGVAALGRIRVVRGHGPDQRLVDRRGLGGPAPAQGSSSRHSSSTDE